MKTLKHISLVRSAASRQPDERDAVAIDVPEETHRERVDTDTALQAVGPVCIPADLQLRLRLALSHERVRAERKWFGRITHRLYLLTENTLRPFAMRGAVLAAGLLLTVGLASTFGAATPMASVEANDIPLIGFSAPRYLYSQSGLASPIASVDEVPLMVEARVSSAGRVYSYRVLSGTVDAANDAALRERMLSGVFKPANFFGEAVRGKVVLTFADVEVHG